MLVLYCTNSTSCPGATVTSHARSPADAGVSVAADSRRARTAESLIELHPVASEAVRRQSRGFPHLAGDRVFPRVATYRPARAGPPQREPQKMLLTPPQTSAPPPLSPLHHGRCRSVTLASKGKGTSRYVTRRRDRVPNAYGALAATWPPFDHPMTGTAAEEGVRERVPSFDDHTRDQSGQS